MNALWRRVSGAGSLPLLIFMLGWSAPASAQDYPTHPVRLITDSAPGSAIDVPVRIIAEGLSRIWGQQAVVINQPGAGGAIAARTAATATPDGTTFGVIAASAFVALPGTADNLPVQVPRDFAPVGYLGGAPMYVAAAPWLNVKTLPDLIALAKQKPGEVSLRRQRHRPPHASHRRIAATAGGIKLLMVPYSGGTAQIISDMMGKLDQVVVKSLTTNGGLIGKTT